MLIPPELISHQWWASILSSLTSSNVDRLLIDNHESGWLRETDSLDFCGLSDRQRLDSLAAVAAFVLGPDLFHCVNASSTQHKVVSWAKHCAKEGNPRKRPQYVEVLGVLTDAVFPFRYTVYSEGPNESRTRRMSDEDWEVRLCPLSASQRSAYEDCCIGARGALSFRYHTGYSDNQHHSKSYQQAMQALLRLRRVCLHSRINDVLRKSTFPAAPFLGLSKDAPPMAASGLSQLHADIAIDILSGSAKLRELVSILRDECDFCIHGDTVMTQVDLMRGIKGSGKKTSTSKGSKRKKVAVLAMLPEAQLLTSVLLASIGVPHEILAPPLMTKSRGESSKHGSRSADNVERCHDATVAWAETQLLLLKFSSTMRSSLGEDNEATATTLSTRQKASCAVIIASPASVGADNGGIGLEAADVIICLDEDWSGRDALLMERVVNKCQFAREVMAGDSESEGLQERSFIRLVCAKTCEQIFLSGFPGEEEKRASHGDDWPSNWQGFLGLPTSQLSLAIPLIDEDGEVDDDDVESGFRFPALNVLRYRGALLSKVLHTTLDMPPDFATGDSIRFLPFQDWEGSQGGDKTSSIELIRSLLAQESLTNNPTRMHTQYQGTNMPRNESETDIYSIGCSSIPPLPAEFPSMVMTRHDMMDIASRIYIDRFGSLLASIEGSGSRSLSTGLLSGPAASGGLSNMANSGITGDHSNLADVWRRSGLSCKPNDFVPSLLLYSSPDSNDDTSNRKRSRDENQTIETENGGERRVPDINKVSSTGLEDQTVAFPTSNVPTSPRLNGFTASYCKARQVVANVVNDGNQGLEPLPYFPPLFPSLLGASQQALEDVARYHGMHAEKMSSARASLTTPGVLPELGSGTLKRKAPTDSTFITEDPKRPRLQNGPIASKGVRPSAIGASLEFSGMPLSVSSISARGTNHTGAPLGDLESVSHGSGQISHPTEPDILTEDEASHFDSASFLFEMGEDYGLLGMGALSSNGDAARDASMLSIGALSYANWKDPYEANGIELELYSSKVSCDAEEVEAYSTSSTDDCFLDTMLLFVTKRAHAPAPASYAGYPVKAHVLPTGGLSFSSAPAAWAHMQTPSGLPASVPITAGFTGGPSADGKANDGTATLKKSKKKNQSSEGAFARINPTDFAGRAANPYLGSSALQSAKGKETYRSKILASILARQGGGRASLFQVPSFLLASIRIRDTVLHRVLGTSMEAIPGFQAGYGVRRSWERAFHRLDSAVNKTGDAARRMSENQRAKILISESTSPVDFGPFATGYISSPYATNRALPPTPRIGITLPMGVKIPHRSREQQVQPWDESDDAKLKEMVLRYGSSWHLVAGGMYTSTGLDILTEAAKSGHGPRSPGQCQERWQYLVRRKASLAEELNATEQMLRKNAVTRPILQDINEVGARRIASIPKRFSKEDARKSNPSTLKLTSTEDSFSLVLPSSLFPEESNEKESSKAGDDGKLDMVKVRGKKSFAAFRSAAKKKIDLPLTIPGAMSGEKPSLVGSDPSHAQSVQAAVSGSSSAGRTEMWPLQIIDLAEKQRASRRNVLPTDSLHAATSGSSSSRQQSGASKASASHSQRSSGHQTSPSHRSSATFPQVPQPMVPPNHGSRPQGSSPSRSIQRTIAPSSQQAHSGHASGTPGVSSNGGPEPHASQMRGPTMSAGQSRPSPG